MNPWDFEAVASASSSMTCQRKMGWSWSFGMGDSTGENMDVFGKYLAAITTLKTPLIPSIINLRNDE